MLEYLSYTVFFITVVILSVYIYIRLKFGFWAIQPVFHVYDVGYMINPPGIIDDKLPEKNKYTNFKNIETILFSDLSQLKSQQFVNLVKCHYLQNNDNIFNPKSENVIPYFVGHNDKTFVSFYTEEQYITHLKKGVTDTDVVTVPKIIGVMTSRPVHISIKNGNKDATFDAYYVDYLCVDTMHRKKGVAPQLIQTHHYNQRQQNKKVVVSLFKREDELTGIVPLCVYSTYGFPVTKWTKPLDLSGEYTLLEINKQNFYFLLDFIRENETQFDISICAEVSNIIELINTKNIFIYVILHQKEIVCAYFFKKSCIEVEKGLEVLTCLGSICSCESSIFIQGFKISFWKISAENYFGYSAIENISHNNIIIDNIVLKTAPQIISPTAYFFYNFAYPTFNSNRVFVLT